MKTQIITVLSIAAVLGTAGGAYAVNQTMLASASNETSVIGSATPVLVPVEPKGADIPADYLEQVAAAAEAASQKPTPAGGLVSSSAGTTSAPAAPAPSATSEYSDDDSENEVEYEDEQEEEEEEEEEDESGDDD